MDNECADTREREQPVPDVMRRHSRNLTSSEFQTLDSMKMLGNRLHHYFDSLGQSREISLAKTNLEQAIMWATKHLTAPLVMLLMLVGCLSPYQEPSGRFIKTSQTEIRSAFGTNQSFARLERCDGPEKKVLWYSHSDFKNCVMLTKAEQDEWQHGYSRGAGPEIVGAAIVGGSVGAGAALSGGANAAAGASASATNIAVQTVGKGKR